MLKVVLNELIYCRTDTTSSATLASRESLVSIMSERALEFFSLYLHAFPHINSTVEDTRGVLSRKLPSLRIDAFNTANIQGVGCSDWQRASK